MKRTVTLLLASLVLLPAMSLAQPGHREGGRRAPMHMQQRMFERLGLTDDQRDQIRKLSLDHAKAQTDIAAKIRVARIDLRELFLTDKLDRNAIEKQMNSVSDLQQRAKINRLDHMFAVYKILTPEQQKKWREHMANMGTWDGSMMRHRPGPGMGMLDDPAPRHDQPEEDVAPQAPSQN